MNDTLSIESLTRKQPRDFIWRDEFITAADDWPHHYPNNQLWLNLHEYKASLAGDQSYLRLLVSGSHDCNLIWQGTLEDSHNLNRILHLLIPPLSYKTLLQLGFQFFSDNNI